METSLSIILAMQDVYLTWLVNNAPFLSLFILVAWLGWKGRDALAQFEKSFDGKFSSFEERFASIEKRLSRLENNFQILIAVLKEKKIIKKSTFKK